MIRWGISVRRRVVARLLRCRRGLVDASLRVQHLGEPGGERRGRPALAHLAEALDPAAVLGLRVLEPPLEEVDPAVELGGGRGREAKAEVLDRRPVELDQLLRALELARERVQAGEGARRRGDDPPLAGVPRHHGLATLDRAAGGNWAV